LTLDAAARRRFARQLLLSEVGEAGQLRLQSSRFRRDDVCDPDAFAVASEYLVRAGCMADANGKPVHVPGEAEIRRFAGTEALLEPAAAILGAFSAVEYIKETLGLGPARTLPSDLTLSDP
jgi:hypothetical protein